MSAPSYTNKVSYTGQYDGTNAPTIKWNTSGGAAGGSPATAKIKAVKFSIENQANIDDQTDENGECVGFIKKPKATKKLTMECVIQADTKANAALALLGPPDLTEIVLANFIATADAVANGAYVYKTGCKVDLGEDDTAKLSFEAMKYSTAAATLLAATT